MKINLLLILLLFSMSAVGQNQPVNTPVTSQPIMHEVSGIIKDSMGEAYPGAVVVLRSEADSLKTSADDNGVFIFTQVKRASFILSISGIGIETTSRKYLFNENTKKIVLPPIDLKPSSNLLKEVKVNGKPAIIYKRDTVEYRASDYKVRHEATVDELLRQMEGMEVGADGSLSYMGQTVAKAKLNGKEFAGGKVSQVIQSLPADIVGKAQIVDDYGDLAEKTGIKSQAPQKILNLTTKSDRSIGNYLTGIGQAGNDSRYSVKLNYIHLNANQQIAFLGRFDDLVNQAGQSSNGIKSGLPGITQSTAPSISYSDQLSKKLQLVTSYNYNLTTNRVTTNSFGQNYSYGENDSVKNSSFFNKISNSKSRTESHLGSIKLDYDIDKQNSLQVRPTFSYSGTNNINDGVSNNLNYFTTGFEHPLVTTKRNDLGRSTTYGISTSFFHTFKKPKRNLSIQFLMNHMNNKSNGDVMSEYQYFADSTENRSIGDSSSHLLTIRTNSALNYRGFLTYAEPVGNNGQLIFEASISKTLNHTAATSDTLFNAAGLPSTSLHVASLNNKFNYSFMESRISLTYLLTTNKLTYALGLTAIPSVLEGSEIDDSNENIFKTPLRRNFRIIPVARMSYNFSSTSRFALTYTGTNTPPDVTAIQPFTDRSDPNNVVIGNPDLQPSFTNALTLNYSKYIPNSQLNLGLNLTGSNIINQTTTNVVQRSVPISSNPTRYRTINEITFVNLNGTYSLNSDYNISKQLNDRKIALILNGTANYSSFVAISNNVKYNVISRVFDERLGPNFALAEGGFLRPYIEYDDYTTHTTLPGTSSTSIKTTSLAIDSRAFIKKVWSFTFTATKSFVTGINGFDKNPFVINAGIERSILNKKNLILTFNAFDLLRQNNFIRQTVTPLSVSNSYSNTLSRYFLLGVHFTIQRWSGTPSRNGKQLQRRGDGSFIYN